MPPPEESSSASYTTVAGEHRNELVLKRSKFITVLQRVESEEAARAALAGLRKEFSGARHHCSAFLLGADRSVQRSADDGEPSGTAGSPMLEVLSKHVTMSGTADLSDVAAVVIRYFGGTLLGAGGLVRAYSDSVSQALAGCQLVTRRRMRILEIPAAHADAGRLENELRAAGTDIVETRHLSSGVVLTVALPYAPAEYEQFLHRLAGLTAGSTTAAAVGTRWVDA